MLEEVRSIRKVCEKHGAYYSKVMRDTVFNLGFETGCPECEKEQEALEREAKLSLQPSTEVYKKKGIPKRFYGATLENYRRETEIQKQAWNQVSEYINNWDDALKHGRSMVFYGMVGTGKTHLACAMVSKCANSRYVEARQYTRYIRESYSNSSKQTESDILHQFTNYDLLAIDEVGKQFATDAERYAMFDLVNSRYNNMKPTVIITNMNYEDTEAFLGVDTMDRLGEMGGQRVLFKWKSYRSKK